MECIIVLGCHRSFSTRPVEADSWFLFTKYLSNTRVAPLLLSTQGWLKADHVARTRGNNIVAQLDSYSCVLTFCIWDMIENSQIK